MPQHSQISLCKLISRQLFRRSPIPTSPFSLAVIPTQRFGNSVSSPKPKPDIFTIPASGIHYFANPTRSFPHTQFATDRNSRNLTGESGEFDQNKEVDMINLKFAEAREEIEMALESKETVYFDEEAECARAAVKEVLDRFEGLLARLPETKKAVLQRSMGLKMEQLKAELQQLED